ncbi:MAG: hypothetical protein WCO65_03325 [bacterium]
MEEYYKDKYEKALDELFFYKGIVGLVCMVANVILYLMFLFSFWFGVFKFVEYRDKLSLSDYFGLITIIGVFLGFIISHRKIIFNWPEELYIRKLKKEKELRDIKK